MKQIDWFSFYPKAIVLKTNALASCTTSLFYVNLFQRTLSLSLPSRTLSIGVSFKCRSFSKADAKVQLFRTRAKCFEGKVCKKSMFLTVIYISRRRDRGVTFYYTCGASGRVGAHKRLIEGRDGGIMGQMDQKEQMLQGEIGRGKGRRKKGRKKRIYRIEELEKLQKIERKGRMGGGGGGGGRMKKGK